MKIPYRIIKKLSTKYGGLIGKGAFSYVFRKSGEDFVTIFSRDRIKECWAYFGTPKHYNNKEIPVGVFPEIKFLDENCQDKNHQDEGSQEIPELENFPEYKLYRMQYFPKIKSLKAALKPRQWKLYKVLGEIFIEGSLIANHWKRIDVYRELFDEKLAGFLSESPGENNENVANYAEIMNAAMDLLINFGDSINFEISPRNVAASESGDLILLDCFFFREDL